MSLLAHHGALIAAAGGGAAVLGFDPANKGASAVLDNGNFDVSTVTGGLDRWAITQTAKAAGKWRQQFLIVAHADTGGVGVATGTPLGGYAGANANAACLFGNYGGQLRRYFNGSSSNYPATFATNDRVDVLVDIEAGKVWWAKNGTVISGDPVAGTGSMFNFTPGATIKLCADTTGGGGRIRLLQPSQFTGSPPAGYVDGW